MAVSRCITHYSRTGWCNYDGEPDMDYGMKQMYRLVGMQIADSATTVHNNGHAILLEYDVIYFHDVSL